MAILLYVGLWLIYDHAMVKKKSRRKVVHIVTPSGVRASIDPAIPTATLRALKAKIERRITARAAQRKPVGSAT